MTFKHQPRTVPITWIVIADRGRATILQSDPDSNSAPEVIEAWENPEGTAHPRDLETARQGYMRGGSRGATPEAAEPSTDVEHQIAASFAKQIIDFLDHGRQTQRFGHVVIAAAPMFLGVLRSQLPSPLEQTIRRTIDKDYTRLSPNEQKQLAAEWVSAGS